MYGGESRQLQREDGPRQRSVCEGQTRHDGANLKRRREIQRAAGLFGKSPGKPGSMDFRGYAGDGFGHDYKDLIKQFLMSGKAEQ